MKLERINDKGTQASVPQEVLADTGFGLAQLWEQVSL